MSASGLSCWTAGGQPNQGSRCQGCVWRGPGGASRLLVISRQAKLVWSEIIDQGHAE